MVEKVQIPITLLKKIADASQVFHALEDELEDFLLAQDEGLLAELDKARENHIQKNVRPFSELRTK